jgi:hypothetical protein
MSIYKFKSTNQKIFYYSIDGYRFNRGIHKNILIKDLYEMDSDGLVELLDNIYSNGSFHTRVVVTDIRRELKIINNTINIRFNELKIQK